MNQHPYRLVDAFTDEFLGGNPCAVFFDCDAFDDDLMLRIAREMNLSETAFLKSSDRADFGVRYFTVVGEIPLAGHPTIATVHALVDRGQIQLSNPSTTITLEMGAGVIPVEIRSGEDGIERITMQQQKPAFLREYSADDILPLVGLEHRDLLPSVPLQTVSTGTPQLMIALRNESALQRATLNLARYEQENGNFDFFGAPHLFILRPSDSGLTTFARHFLPPPASGEDPFTGSATGGMAAFCWHYRLIDKPEFVAEQGHWMGRPGRAWVRVEGSRETPDSVRVGGRARTVIRGNLTI